MMKQATFLLIALFFTQIALALNPSRTYKQRPEKYNMEYKETFVKTKDGKKLVVWNFLSKNKKTTETVLIAHSGEGNMADYLRRVDQFRSTYNVVIFDYRGYGESSDFEIDKDMYIYPHFQDDLTAMINYVSKQHVPKFHLYGWGIGAGLGLGIGSSHTAIKSIIADTPFLSMEDLEERFGSWDEPLKVPFKGYNEKYQPIYALERMSNKSLTKVMIIIGSNDILFKKADMQQLQAKQPKIIRPIYVVENPDRKDNFSASKEYMKNINQFLGGK